ncbi:MAG: hypothetical protein RL701_8041, partial [Pseudomonadota bacterium]
MPGAAQATPGVRRQPSLLRKWLPLLGLAILGWVLSRLDAKELVRAFGRVGVSALALSCAAFSLNLWLKVWRWQRLLRAQSISLPHRYALPAFLSAQFYAQITIGRVGEFLRIEALTERGVSAGTALASCVFDRLLDVILVLFTGLGLGALWLGDVRVAIAAGAVALSVLLGVAALFVVFGGETYRGPGAGLLVRLETRPSGARSLRTVRELARGMRPMLRPRALLEASAWTLAAWCCYFEALF